MSRAQIFGWFESGNPPWLIPGLPGDCWIGQYSRRGRYIHSDQDLTGQVFQFDTVIDTGFNGALSMPPSTLKSLGLARDSEGSAVLADGSVIRYDIYRVEVDWDGSWSPISIWALGSEPPLGCGLLRGHELRIQFKDDGDGEIKKL